AILSFVYPDVRSEIRMGDVDTCVDDGDDDARTTGGDRPGLAGVDVGVRGARRPVHGLAEVVEAPELVHERIVREVVGVDDAVGLCKSDAAVTVETANRARDAIGGD